MATNLIGTLIQAGGIYALTWVVWRLSRRYTMKSPLDNIPGPRPTSMIFGNLKDMDDSVTMWKLQEDLMTKWNGVVKLKGFLNENMLYVFDPVAAYNVLLRDHYVYESPHFARSWSKILFGDGVFAVTGSQHKAQRKMMNPLFSIAQLRSITPTFQNVARKLCAAITTQVQSRRTDSGEIDVLDWLSRAALELIGQGGLGYSFDQLVEGKPNELGDAIKNIAPSLSGGLLSYGDVISTLDVFGDSSSFKLRLLDSIPFTQVKQLVSCIRTIHDGCQNIYEEKKAALMAGEDAVVHQVGEGKDIMSVLLKANLEAVEQDRLSENEVIGQMCSLVFAASDTTSSALARTLYILAQHQDVQDKLREEILKASNNSGAENLSYDEIVDLPYLDTICRETLRLYPPVGLIFKETNEDTILPFSKPIVGIDGSLISEIPVPKGTKVFVGITASNRTPELWGEDALEWKPERWLSTLPRQVLDAKIPGVYANLLTFSGGGRACIGFKFSQLEMKVILSTLIESFRFKPSKNHSEIYWNATRIVTPSIGPGNSPTMPMEVTLIKDD
ncbi:cytochrome P450 [Abortiporus biennis]|nr:cytochrome P450 [Abortiporus biennis]